MLAVMFKQSIMGALEEGTLCSIALHIVEPDDTRPRPKWSSPGGWKGRLEAEHTTCHVSIFNAPQVVTDGAPPTRIVVDLYATFQIGGTIGAIESGPKNGLCMYTPMCEWVHSVCVWVWACMWVCMYNTMCVCVSMCASVCTCVSVCINLLVVA